MKSRLGLMALCSGLFVACLKDSPTTLKAEPQPGQLRLGTLAEAKSAARKMSLQDSGSSDYEFDLGEASGSAQRFFILKNLGDIDIRNITLTTDNPRFYFSPSTIKVLPPSKSSYLLQIITLNVIHGRRLDGFGPDSLLLMGENHAVVHIAGVTADGSGASMNISEDAGFEIFARVLDFKIYRPDSTEMDMSQYGLVSGPVADFTSDPIRQWDSRGETVKLVNTGNAPFKVRVWRMAEDQKPVMFDSSEVQSGESFNLTGGYVEIDGHGVVMDQSKVYLQPARNGKIYLAL